MLWADFSSPERIGGSATDGRERRRWAGLIWAVVAVGVVDLFGIWWGLPNRDRTWAADELGPVAPLALAHKVLSDPPNSGWFYFKYPLGHPLFLSAVYAPVIAAAWVAGRVGAPAKDYPYGLRSPDPVLTTLTCVGRLVSVGAAVLLAILVAGVTDSLFGRGGALAALLVGLSYPFVFYAHTSNVDIASMAWSMLALWAGLRTRIDGRPRYFALVGAAAGMAVAVKEPALGLVAPALVLTLSRRWQSRAGFFGAAVAVGVCALVVVSVASGAIWNPLGAINRVRYLLGLLPADLVARYAPYSFPVAPLEGRGWSGEIAQMGRAASAVANSLGCVPALFGAAGLLGALVWRPRASLWLWLTGCCYYLVAVRSMNTLMLRYTMPLTLVIGIAAGGSLAWLGERGRTGRLLVAGAMLPTLLAGLEVDRMLIGDPRYRAEEWLAQHASHGSRIEVYQIPTYLPRFREDLRVEVIPMEERREDLFRRRHPDFVVISAAARQRLDHGLNRDWRNGRPPFLPEFAAVEFFDKLRSGKLGYVAVASFATEPIFLRERITSLNPETTIYARGTPAPESARAAVWAPPAGSDKRKSGFCR